MPTISKQVNLDVAVKNQSQYIVAKQYDSHSRFLKVQLLNDTVKLNINKDATVTINARRPDGSSNSFLGSINDDGTLLLPISNWMLEQSGTLRCDVSVVSGEEKLSSTLFSIEVESSANPGDNISDDEQYDLLTELLLQVNNTVDDANAALSKANSSLLLADQAYRQANSVVTDAQQAAQSANLAADRANIAAQKTENIVESEEIVTQNYTNQIPISIDTNGAIYNGTGYKSGFTLKSNGAEQASAGTIISGFIPIKKGDVIRVKDTSQVAIDTTLMFVLYDSNKTTTANIGKTIASIQGNAVYGSIAINGNEVTWNTSSISYYFWSDPAYLRVTVKSSNAIVTINEAIEETVTEQMVLKSNVKVKEDNFAFPVAKPILANKKVAVFGDSIIGLTRDDTSIPAYASAYAGGTFYNLGFGGCRMSVHPTTGYAAFSMWALADAITTGNYTTQDAQASSGQDYFPAQLALLKSINFNSIDDIVIHYGTNDFGGSVPIDNAADDDDTSTLCGALRYSIRKIQSVFPKIHIFISVPIYRMWGTVGAENYTNSLSKKLIEYVSALKEVAQEFNLPVIDGYSTMGVNSINDNAYSTDGTHLNDYGRKIFGEIIGGKIICPSSLNISTEQTVSITGNNTFYGTCSSRTINETNAKIYKIDGVDPNIQFTPGMILNVWFIGISDNDFTEYTYFKINDKSYLVTLSLLKRKLTFIPQIFEAGSVVTFMVTPFGGSSPEFTLANNLSWQSTYNGVKKAGYTETIDQFYTDLANLLKGGTV